MPLNEKKLFGDLLYEKINMCLMNFYMRADEMDKHFEEVIALAPNDKKADVLYTLADVAEYKNKLYYEIAAWLTENRQLDGIEEQEKFVMLRKTILSNVREKFGDIILN